MLAGISVFPGARRAAGQRVQAVNLLAEKYSAGALARLLVARDAWKPFPTAAERDQWRGLPDRARRQLLETGLRHRGRLWPALPASLFLEFQAAGREFAARDVEYRADHSTSELSLDIEPTTSTSNDRPA